MYEQRINRVLEQMERQGISQLMVTEPSSIWYLTGYYHNPFERLFALYIRKGRTPVFFLNKLFCISGTPYKEISFIDTDDYMTMVANEMDVSSPLGVDKEWTARFLIPLMERCPGMRVVLGSDCVDYCRARKDEAELELMRENSRINDKVIQKAAAYIKVGMTEKQVSEFFVKSYKEAGCEDTAFIPLASFGANAANPHHEPDNTVLEEGMCVLFDVGGRKGRYCSDMTRTYICGKPAPEFEKIHEIVVRANETAEKLIKPGVPLRELDRAARAVIENEGYGEYFTHRLGHFIGQTDHEKGDVSLTTDLIAEPGMVFSIEPGIYLEGKYGVRIEDLVIVTETGCEVLNKVEKKLQNIG